MQTGGSRIHNVRVLRQSFAGCRSSCACSVEFCCCGVSRSSLTLPTCSRRVRRAQAFVSSLCSRTKARRGGADRDRTDDLKLAKLPLSQLSYGPVKGSASDQVVGPERVERSTSRLSGVRSNHLSYEPISVPWKGLNHAAFTTQLCRGANSTEGRGTKAATNLPIV